MKEQFIPYHLALQLKQLGFNQPCIGYYNQQTEELFPYQTTTSINGHKCAAPLWQQAFDYFREDHNLCSWIYQSNKNHFYFSILKENRFVANSEYFESFNKAKLSCLENLILKVKSKDA